MELKHILSVAIVAATASLATVSGDATAQVVAGATMANASGRCVSALPAFESAFRKRPLALQNEGTSSAFVTCTFPGETADNGYSGLYLYARSTDGTASALSCTAVLGFDSSPNVKYATKTVDVQADGSQVELAITGADFTPAGITSRLINLSCSVPAGVALNDTYLEYERGSEPTGN